MLFSTEAIRLSVELSSGMKKRFFVLGGVVIAISGLFAITPNFQTYYFPYSINGGPLMKPRMLSAIDKAKEERDYLEVPKLGQSCVDMQNYFNKKFGRNDTEFSNFLGQVQQFGNVIICDGGAVIQTYPTGKKTCTDANIVYATDTQEMRWNTQDASNCYTSAN